MKERRICNTIILHEHYVCDKENIRVIGLSHSILTEFDMSMTFITLVMLNPLK